MSGNLAPGCDYIETERSFARCARSVVRAQTRARPLNSRSRRARRPLLQPHPPSPSFVRTMQSHRASLPSCRRAASSFGREAVSKKSADSRSGSDSGVKRTRSTAPRRCRTHSANDFRDMSTLARHPDIRPLFVSVVHGGCCAVRFSHASLRFGEEEIVWAHADRGSRAGCVRSRSD